MTNNKQTQPWEERTTDFLFNNDIVCDDVKKEQKIKQFIKAERYLAKQKSHAEVLQEQQREIKASDFREAAIVQAANGEAEQRLTTWKADVIIRCEKLKIRGVDEKQLMNTTLGGWMTGFNDSIDEIITLIKKVK